MEVLCMKKRIVFVMSTVCALSLVWCGTRAAHHANTEHPYAGAPKIVLDGQNYLAKELDIVNELPETLDKEKLAKAVDELFEKYSPGVASVYLQMFQLQTEDGWDELADVLANDPRVTIR